MKLTVQPLTFPLSSQDRLEIILNSWIDFGHVPSPAEVSKEEGIDFLWTKSGSFLLRF
jgi:hypothetical protein